MNNMGADLFELSWIKAIVLFFSYFGWALYVTGLVVAVFDTAIGAQTGRVDIKGTALNFIKGFFAVCLFTTVPVELYKTCISLQGTLTQKSKQQSQEQYEQNKHIEESTAEQESQEQDESPAISMSL
jgi:hypothetical protein